MSDYNILDLFCGLGGFSQAFVESDRWDVTTVDINPEFEPDICADVMELRPSDFETEFDVVVASPPCQYLSTAGNHDKWDYDAKEPTHPDSRDAVALFEHTLGLIRGLTPEYWYVENPRRSRIRWFIGEPDEWVAYCQYGESYQKQTGLWGEFADMTFKRCSGRGACHNANGADDGYTTIQSMPSSGAERAKVPYELSESIRTAVEDGFENPSPEQTTLCQAEVER